MAYNHAKEEKKFKEQWKHKEQLYRESGMTDEQISVIREYDEESFKLDRAFYRRTMLLAEPERINEGKFDEHSETFLEENWTELIDSEEKYQKLMKIPYIMLRAYYMYKVLKLYQDEISSKLSIPQRTISYWIMKITKILK